MSVNLYQTGVSGLLAAQQQLATTGHNVANVNTEGYTRQRAEQGAAIGNFNGDNFIGSGTYIQDITRIYDKFSYREQLINQGGLGHAKSINLDLDKLDNILSNSNEAIGGSLNKMYQSINNISDNPSDLGLRKIALSQAKVIASDFNALNRNFEQLEKSTNGEIEQIATKISEISKELANINEQILQNRNLKDTGKPNDLLDKRDQMVMELGQYTSVNTLQDDNGVMTVMIGNGTTLVAGVTALTVSVKAGDPDATKTQLQLNSAVSSVSIDGAKLGGAMAAKFEFRDEHLSKASAELNRLSLAISDTLNQAQSKGLDLNGKQGNNIFSDINTTVLMNSRVSGLAKNTGGLVASVKVTDVSKLPADDFTVEYNGTDYIMTKKSDGSTTNLGAPGSGTYATPFGFEFNEVSGTPNSGDTFELEPTKNASSLMQVTLTDPKGFAASSAIGVKASDDNVSNGKVSIVNVTDPEVARSYTEGTNAKLTVDVYESAAGTFSYRVYNEASPPPAAPIANGTFTAGSTATIDMPPSPSPTAFQIEISGSPKGESALAREKFTISDVFGSGNGTNATALAATQEQRIVDGKQTFSQTLAVASSEVGSNAKSAETAESTAQALFTQAFNRNQSKSGVNLDEEAANMLKFQQAYQASSKIISVANTIFDTLLSVAR